MGYLFVDLSVNGQLDTYLPRLKDTATRTKGKINWVYIDWTKFSKHSERMGLSGTVVPSLAIDDYDFHYAFDETKDPTAELIDAWVQSYLDKTLPPTIKSEPIPTDNSAPVKVIVAKNFEEMVIDSPKNVLIEFYAPWCGHCKQLAPIYDEVGKAFEDSSDVTISKMDATANDVSSKYSVRGFPTIKFFPAGAKESPIDYEGERTKEAFVSWINENSRKVVAGSGKGKEEL